MPERWWSIPVREMLGLALIPEVTGIWDAEVLRITSQLGTARFCAHVWFGDAGLLSLHLWHDFWWNCAINLLSHYCSCMLDHQVFAWVFLCTCPGQKHVPVFLKIERAQALLSLLISFSLSRCGRVRRGPGQLQYRCHLSEHPQVIQMHLQIRIQRWWETLRR